MPENSNWELVNISTIDYTLFFPGEVVTKTVSVRVILDLKRRSRYVVMNLLGPAGLILTMQEMTVGRSRIFIFNRRVFNYSMLCINKKPPKCRQNKCLKCLKFVHLSTPLPYSLLHLLFFF